MGKEHLNPTTLPSTTQSSSREEFRRDGLDYSDMKTLLDQAVPPTPVKAAPPPKPPKETE